MEKYILLFLICFVFSVSLMLVVVLLGGEFGDLGKEDWEVLGSLVVESTLSLMWLLPRKRKFKILPKKNNYGKTS